MNIETILIFLDASDKAWRWRFVGLVWVLLLLSLLTLVTRVNVIGILVWCEKSYLHETLCQLLNRAPAFDLLFLRTLYQEITVIFLSKRFQLFPWSKLLETSLFFRRFFPCGADKPRLLGPPNFWTPLGFYGWKNDDRNFFPVINSLVP